MIASWVLVAAGLAVIGVAINASYRYFTAKAEFPAVFKVSAKNPAAICRRKPKLKSFAGRCAKLSAKSDTIFG